MVPDIKEVGVVILPYIDHIGNCASLAPPTPEYVFQTSFKFLDLNLHTPVVVGTACYFTFMRELNFYKW